MQKTIIKTLMLALLVAPMGIAMTVGAAALPNWDISNSYVANFNYLGTDYAHDVTVVQDGLGNLTGNGGSPAGSPVYTWVITSGSVAGDTVDFFANYTATPDAVTPLTVMHVIGTVAGDGSMSGTWSDNYQAGSRAGTWTTTSGTAVSILPADITVTAENFNTNKSTDYYGATVGYALGGADTALVASVSVSLYDASNNLMVTNTSKSAAKVNNTLQGPHYSSAFLVQAGTYATSSTWNFGAWTPNIGVVPAKAVITVTDLDGHTYTAQNTSFQASEPSHPTWESLFSGSLTAEDFGVVSYDTGLGMLRGYTAGFGLTDATFFGAQSVVVQLYSGATLLQTNTATAQVGIDITGAQISTPFDVSGTFNYATDGYWTNVRETQYGQSEPATRVVATVTLHNGKVVTAENTLLTGDPTTIYPTTTPPVVTTPTEKSQCKNNGWKSFTNPSFKNQGQCVSYVEHLKERHEKNNDRDDDKSKDGHHDEKSKDNDKHNEREDRR